MTSKPIDPPSYSQVACVGAGLSAVALGATLKRWYDLEDIRFFERHPTSGGTWYISTYPGSSGPLALSSHPRLTAYRMRLRCPERPVQFFLRPEPQLDEAYALKHGNQRLC